MEFEMMTDLQNPPGLLISASGPILSFLSAASKDPQISPKLQQIASYLSSHGNVPYKRLQGLWFAACSLPSPFQSKSYPGPSSSSPGPNLERKMLLGGILGLVGGMLLETLQFIIGTFNNSP